MKDYSDNEAVRSTGQYLVSTKGTYILGMRCISLLLLIAQRVGVYTYLLLIKMSLLVQLTREQRVVLVRQAFELAVDDALLLQEGEMQTHDTAGSALR